MQDPNQPTDSAGEDQPDTIATPEGDSEFAPDQPLSPHPPDLTRPRGDEPHTAQPLRDALD